MNVNVFKAQCLLRARLDGSEEAGCKIEMWLRRNNNMARLWFPRRCHELLLQQEACRAWHLQTHFYCRKKKKGKNPWQRNRGRVSTAANKNKMQNINGSLYREQQIISDIVSFPLGCVHESRRWTLSAVKCALCTVTDSVLSSQGFEWKMRKENASSDMIINCVWFSQERLNAFRLWLFWCRVNNWRTHGGRADVAERRLSWAGKRQRGGSLEREHDGNKQQQQTRLINMQADQLRARQQCLRTVWWMWAAAGQINTADWEGIMRRNYPVSHEENNFIFRESENLTPD